LKMFKSYFYFYRFVLENTSELENSEIKDIYTQEKNKLFLSIPTADYPFRHLIINSSPQLSSIIIKKEHHKAKKNFKNFLEEFLPLTIEKIEICNDDRILRFSLTADFQMYFAIMGSKTNVYFLSRDLSFSFRKSDTENFTRQLQNKNFVTPTKNFRFTERKFNNFTEARERFPFLNKQIQNEYLLRTRFEENDFHLDIVEKICDEIISSDICLAHSPIENSVKIFPETWQTFSEFKILNKYSKINDAVRDFLIFFYRFEKEKKLRKELKNLIENQLEKTANKLNELKNRIEKGSRESEYRLKADLLALNRQRLRKGLREIKLTDFTTGKEILILLDEKLDGQGNIDKYYSKARDEKINFEKSLELYRGYQKKYDELFELRKRLDDISDLKELEFLKKELTKGKVQGTKQNKIKFRHFLIDGKYHVFVGRESKDNDELTFNFAKKNDFWFHARGYPGSHVILRVENKKEPVPKNILKDAASLAAYYSKAKTAGLVPVSYTFRKFVHKRKGMPPGQVLLQKEDTLIVKPEIPKNSEQIFE